MEGVEHMHQTLMGKAHTMRLSAKCPLNLWDEFYLTAAHLHGKTKIPTAHNVTPDKLWYGQKSNYLNIKEIGC